MQIRSVEVEFTEDTFGSDGNVKRNKGERAWVDQISAHSFVDIKKVARRVADGPALTTDRRVPKRKKVIREPEEPVDEQQTG